MHSFRVPPTRHDSPLGYAAGALIALYFRFWRRPGDRIEEVPTVLSLYNVSSPLSPVWGGPSNPLQSTMNRLLEDFETAFSRPVLGQASRRSDGPRVQVLDRGDSVALFADLPGLSLDDIEIAIEGEVVTLEAKSKARPAPEGFTPLRRERRPAAVRCSFELPYPIDAASASAVLEQGRLSVTLPKAPEAKRRNIPVKAA
jgi:HSP20 family protein